MIPILTCIHVNKMLLRKTHDFEQINENFYVDKISYNILGTHLVVDSKNVDMHMYK